MGLPVQEAYELSQSHALDMVLTPVAQCTQARCCAPELSMLGAAPNCQNPEFDRTLPPINVPVTQAWVHR